jgi:N-formylmaleamate deformylase
MTSWKSGVCDANGIKIHYQRTGGRKPAVVLLHGLIGSGACWTLLARALEAEYDVLMPDARGHGGSSTPLSGYRYENYAADVLEFIRELGLSAPILLGHSMGGMTAAVVASKPDVSLRGVVLADPTFLSPERQREVHESDVAEQHRRLPGQDGEGVLTEARRRNAHRNPELVEIVVNARLQARMAAFDVLIPPNPDYRELVGAIRVPTLLIIADGGVVSPETAEELKRFNARLCVEQIRDAGHGLHYDQPGRFAMIVTSFLGSLGAEVAWLLDQPREEYRF